MTNPEAQMAWRLRLRGLLLGEGWKDPKVNQIAKRQAELFAEMNRLDEELRVLAEAPE